MKLITAYCSTILLLNAHAIAQPLTLKGTWLEQRRIAAITRQDIPFTDSIRLQITGYKCRLAIGTAIKYDGACRITADELRAGDYSYRIVSNSPGQLILKNEEGLHQIVKTGEGE